MTPPTTGKFKCSLQEYHSYPAVGRTALMVLIDHTPAHYLHALENPSPETPAKILGAAIHQACLEPKLFKEKMIVKPVFEGYTLKGELTTNENCKEVKEKSAQWHMENHGKTILTLEQFTNIGGMLRAISSHSRAAKLISDGHAEESLFWTDPESGIQCKSRPDFVREGHIVVELKSTDNASYRSFQKDIANFGYHIQAAMQLDACDAVFGGNHDTHIIIAVEKEAPYAVNCFQLDDMMISEGRQLYIAALKTIQECTKSGKWPAFGDQLTPISLPSWALPVGL